MPAERANRGVAVAGAASVSLFLLSGYLRTMSPSIQGDDPGELQFLSWALGIPHVTGYPLFIWLGKLFTLIASGDIARRVTLLATVSGAAATALVFLIVWELVEQRTLIRFVAAGIAAVALGLSYTFWYVSLIAEMYSLHVFLALSVLYLLLRWSREQQDWQMMAAALVWGAMFGNHLSSLALGPGVVAIALLYWPRQWLEWRRTAKVKASFLLGFGACNVLLFWLLYRRHVAFDQYHSVILANPDLFPLRDTFWSAWWYTVTGGQFRYAMSVDRAWQLQQLAQLPHRMMGQFFPVGALLAVLGWGALWRRTWRFNLLLTALFLTQSALNMHYEVWKVTLYYVTPYACAAIWIGVALGELGGALEVAASRLASGKPLRQRLLLGGMLPLAVATLGLLNLLSRDRYRGWLAKEPGSIRDNVINCLDARPDQSQDTWIGREARSIVDRLPPDAMVLASWTLLYPIQYVARVERGIETLTAYETTSFPFGGRLSGSMRARIEANLGKRPVYLAEDPSVLLAWFQVQPAGPGLWHVDWKPGLRRNQ